MNENFQMISKYHEETIDSIDKMGLDELERKIKEPIPRVDKVNEKTFGFVLKDKHVTGLGLYSKPIKIIESEILRFPYLKVLNLSNCRLLERAPYYLRNLGKLEYIYLNYCNFIPDTSKLIYLKNLKLLSIKEIPFSIDDKEKLINSIPELKIISPPLTPLKLYKELKEQNKSKIKIVKEVNHLLTSSDLKYVRVSCLEVFKRMNLKTREIFQIIKNSLLKDNSWEVRIKATEVLMKLFPDHWVAPIKSLIQNEVFVIALKNILDLINFSKDRDQTIILNEILGKYSKYYDIIPDEAQLILDLDYLDPWKSNPRGLGKVSKLMNEFKDSTISKSVKGLTDISRRERPYIAIKDKHIIGIKIQEDIKEIPKSIACLKKLRFLHIYSNNLITIPKSIGSLHHLRELKIKSINLSSLPKEVFDIAKKYTYGKYIWEGICPRETPVLGLLEILGWRLINVLSEKRSNPDWYYYEAHGVNHYKLNKEGHIIGIFIIPYEELGLPFFPEEICTLKHLEELYLTNNNIKTIPKAIINLKSLRVLDLRNHEGSCPLIPNSAKNFIDSLEMFRFQY